MAGLDRARVAESIPIRFGALERDFDRSGDDTEMVAVSSRRRRSLDDHAVAASREEWDTFGSWLPRAQLEIVEVVTSVTAEPARCPPDAVVTAIIAGVVLAISASNSSFTELAYGAPMDSYLASRSAVSSPSRMVSISAIPVSSNTRAGVGRGRDT